MVLRATARLLDIVTALRTACSVAAAVAVCIVSTSCGPAGLDFRQDHRLAMVSPQDFSSVRLPLTVHWRFSQALGQPGGAAAFGVFVDAAPIGPGDSVRSLDRAGRATLTVTTRTALPLSGLDTTGGSSTEHDVTVVLLDASGRRLGEAAAHLAFYLET